MKSRSSPELQIPIPLHTLDFNLLASVLRLLIKGFFLLYIFLFLRLLLPIQLGNPEWIRAFIYGAVLNAPIPLVAMMVLILCAQIFPVKNTIQLLRFSSRWALPAAIGFLLLLPVQGYLTYRTVRTADLSSLRVEEVRSQLDSLREPIRTAGSMRQLEEALKPLPPQVSQRAASLPLNEARRLLLENIDREMQALRTRQRLQRSQTLWNATRETIFHVGSCLVLARILYGCRRSQLARVFRRSPTPVEPRPTDSPPSGPDSSGPENAEAKGRPQGTA